MIKYMQYTKKYKTQTKEFIRRTMLNSLKITEVLVDSITKDLEDIEESYLKDGGNFWIAIDSESDEIIGTVGIKKLSKDDAEFKRYYVKKEYRNKGIGRSLYKLAEDFIQKAKIKDLYLASGRSLSRAHKIYEKNNWKKVDIEKNIHNIFVREDAYLFKKSYKL